MLKHRVISGLLLGAALIASIVWMPPLGVLAILLVVVTIALLEYYRLVDAAGIPNYRYVGLSGGVCLVAVTWASPNFNGISMEEAESFVIVFFALVIVIRQFPQHLNDRPIQTIAASLLGFIYIAFLFNFVTKLLVGWGLWSGRLLLLYLLFVVKFTDMGAYFIGSRFGKHKMFPRLSPAKSWEGTLGGIAVATLVSLAIYTALDGNLRAFRLQFHDALILGVLLAVAGVLGDLVESLFKRAAGVKDSGSKIRGMGGLLDLLDSPLFAAPVLYVYARLFL